MEVGGGIARRLRRPDFVGEGDEPTGDLAIEGRSSAAESGRPLSLCVFSVWCLRKTSDWLRF